MWIQLWLNVVPPSMECMLKYPITWLTLKDTSILFNDTISLVNKPINHFVTLIVNIFAQVLPKMFLETINLFYKVLFTFNKFLLKFAGKYFKKEFFFLLWTNYKFCFFNSSAGSPCNNVGHCDSRVKCTQKYGIINLISLEEAAGEDNYPNNAHNHLFHHKHHTNIKCPQIKMFRLPTACVCELSSF